MIERYLIRDPDTVLTIIDSDFPWTKRNHAAPLWEISYVVKSRIPDGKNVLETADRAWAGISRVWYYRPSIDKALRVVMVIHGGGRPREMALRISRQSRTFP
jgi:acetyl esterase/lipase